MSPCFLLLFWIGIVWYTLQQWFILRRIYCFSLFLIVEIVQLFVQKFSSRFVQILL